CAPLSARYRTHLPPAADRAHVARLATKQKAEILKAESRNPLRLVQRPCEARFLGLEIGASQSALPVGAELFRRPPHIALSGAFFAFRASVCNRWPRRWVSGRRREWRPGRTCRIPA